MARALGSRRVRANFLPVLGTDLFSKYLGDSEKNIRDLFQLARKAYPCVVFIDEIDALASRRGDSGDSAGVDRRVLGALLTYVHVADPYVSVGS